MQTSKSIVSDRLLFHFPRNSVYFIALFLLLIGCSSEQSDKLYSGSSIIRNGSIAYLNLGNQTCELPVFSDLVEIENFAERIIDFPINIDISRYLRGFVILLAYCEEFPNVYHYVVIDNGNIYDQGVGNGTEIKQLRSKFVGHSDNP